jgi:hypothetical protein
MNPFKRTRYFPKLEVLEDRTTPSVTLGEMPLEALDGLTNAADHNASSQASHSPLFGDSDGDDTEDSEHPAKGPPADKGPDKDKVTGTDNAASHNSGSQAAHSPIFSIDTTPPATLPLKNDTGAPKTLPALPDAAAKGNANALSHNVNSQAPAHSPRMGAFRPPHTPGQGQAQGQGQGQAQGQGQGQGQGHDNTPKPDNAAKGLANAAVHNAGSQAPNHAHPFRT